MEKENKISPAFCYVAVGGRKFRVGLPMTGKTADSLAIAQSGGEAPMTEQIKPIIKIPRVWRRYLMKGFPSGN
ncbi:hypothetical protein HYW44_02620 [Candidatus Daviesbacteria bacterium]|nr:hypothetical protein [Candidatus Daviesbacteria bacterium]